MEHSDPVSSPRRLLIQGEKRTGGYHTVQRLNQRCMTIQITWHEHIFSTRTVTSSPIAASMSAIDTSSQTSQSISSFPDC
jgi:hypothetical protein